MITVREYPGHRLKSAASARDVPIPDPLMEALNDHAGRNEVVFADRVFSSCLGDYRRAYRLFGSLVKEAQLDDVRIHDLRHTYGVHSAQSGVPLPRIQRLLRHPTVGMTMRYASHAPESYFSEDAAKIAASIAKVRGEAVLSDAAPAVLKLA